MSKPWAEHSADEQREILDRIADIYAEHKHPTWLKRPTMWTNVFNDLPISEQSIHVGVAFNIEGKAPPEESGQTGVIR